MNILLQPGFRRLTLKNFKYSLTCVLIPLLIYSVILHGTRLMSEKAEWERNNQQTLVICEDILTEIWSSVTQNATNLINSNDVLLFSRIDKSSYSRRMLDLFENIQLRLSSVSSSSTNISEIVVSVSNPPYYIYSRGGISSTNTVSSNFTEYYPKFNTPLFLSSRLYNEEAPSQWLAYQNLLYCYARSSTAVDQPITCLIAINPLTIQERLNSYLNEHQGFLLLDPDGNVLLQTNGAKKLPQTDRIVWQNNEWQHILSSRFSANGWTLIINSHESRFSEAITKAIGECAALLLIVSILVSILASLITIRICRPYQTIVALLNEPVQDASGNYAKDYADVDDLGIIHTMIHHTKYQLFAAQNELESKESLLKNARIQALKSQINPHFLHNTLENINMKALRLSKGQPNEISGMICDLSTLMRLSVDIDRNLIPLREEIEHAKVYLKIQQCRFPGRFTVAWDVPDELLDIMVIALTIQPLLENALTHGIRKMKEPGRITVSCHINRGVVHLTVSDNGPGFDPTILAQTKKMLSGSILHTSEHVGLFNVNQRLRLTFSDEYGLSLESIPHDHTSLTMSFPEKWNT